MKINKNELRVVVDVDNTLVRNTKPNDNQGLIIDYYGSERWQIPLFKNIDLLKAQKARGYEVIVHSANGYQWAENVVKALKLEDFVDKVETKPLKYIDDRPADDWMQRIYISEEE